MLDWRSNYTSSEELKVYWIGRLYRIHIRALCAVNDISRQFGESIHSKTRPIIASIYLDGEIGN